MAPLLGTLAMGCASASSRGPNPVVQADLARQKEHAEAVAQLHRERFVADANAALTALGSRIARLPEAQRDALEAQRRLLAGQIFTASTKMGRDLAKMEKDIRIALFQLDQASAGTTELASSR